MCNETIHGLRRIYSNVANRGEVTKEVIESAVRHGVIKFDLRDVTLSYRKKELLVTYFVLFPI